MEPTRPTVACDPVAAARASLKRYAAGELGGRRRGLLHHGRGEFSEQQPREGGSTRVPPMAFLYFGDVLLVSGGEHTPYRGKRGCPMSSWSRLFVPLLLSAAWAPLHAQDSSLALAVLGPCVSQRFGRRSIA